MKFTQKEADAILGSLALTSLSSDEIETLQKKLKNTIIPKGTIELNMSEANTILSCLNFLDTISTVDTKTYTLTTAFDIGIFTKYSLQKKLKDFCENAENNC